MNTDKKNFESALLAAGCFWGVEDILRKIPGVINTEVGYTGGATQNPIYQDVKTGTTGHAEAVLIEFNPDVVSYLTILEYFFRLHDPTTLNRQGNDVGTQYRSAIFYYNDKQKEEAELAKQAAQSSGRWSNPIATQILKASDFYKAESYHQDYLEKNPNGYTCHWLRE